VIPTANGAPGADTFTFTPLTPKIEATARSNVPPPPPTAASASAVKTLTFTPLAPTIEATGRSNVPPPPPTAPLIAPSTSTVPAASVTAALLPDTSSKKKKATTAPPAPHGDTTAASFGGAATIRPNTTVAMKNRFIEFARPQMLTKTYLSSAAVAPRVPVPVSALDRPATKTFAATTAAPVPVVVAATVAAASASAGWIRSGAGGANTNTTININTGGPIRVAAVTGTAPVPATGATCAPPPRVCPAAARPGFSFTPRTFSTPTTFHGVQYRSRLESRLAHLMCELKIRFLYEPMRCTLPNGTNYTIDFFLPDQQLYVELKPKRPHIEEEFKCEQMSRQGFRVTLLYGWALHKPPFRSETAGKVIRDYLHHNALRGITWIDGRKLPGDTVFVVGRHATFRTALDVDADDQAHLNQPADTSDPRWAHRSILTAMSKMEIV
jgi:hypothetical protein